MRTVILFVLALFLHTAPAFGQVEFVQNKTDEFTGNRIVQTAYENVTVQEEASDEPLTLSKSSVLYADGEWAFSIATQSDSWALLGTDTAYFLADGERFETKLHRQTGETQDYGVYEEHFVLLTELMRSVFSQATQVRMKTGKYVFDITDAVDDEIEAVESEI